MHKLCRVGFFVVIIFWAGVFLSVDYFAIHALAQDSQDTYIYDYHDKLIDSLTVTNPGSQRGLGVSDPLGQGGLSTDSIGYPVSSDMEKEYLDVNEYYLPEGEVDPELTGPVDLTAPTSPEGYEATGFSDRNVTVREIPTREFKAEPALTKPDAGGRSFMTEEQLKEYERRVQDMLNSAEREKKSP